MSSQHKFAKCAGALAVTFALAVSAPTLAQDASPSPPSGMGTGCASFKWPLDSERKSFEDAGIETIVSGAARSGWKDQAFSLALQPDASVAYTVPPEKKKPSEEPRFGGNVDFPAPEKPGNYQVTLSSEGWIDVVQRGAALDAADHSGANGCPGLRKSVRFKVSDGPVVLQISDAQADSIKIAIRAVD